MLEGFPLLQPPSSTPAAAETSAAALLSGPTRCHQGIRRIALCLQYDGSAFNGWQRQRNAPSVQATLEQAIRALDPSGPGAVMAAGRTDTGVHAAGQVAHFDCAGPIPPQRWPKALNGRLPSSLRVVAASAVSTDWHACFSASYRRYRYTLYNGRRPNLFLAPWSWHRYQVRLDEARMLQALKPMLGEHDFAAFQRAGSRRSHSRTCLQDVSLVREGDLIRVELQASGFLYGMVRLVMGQLVAVGEGRLNLDDFERRWRQCEREAVREAAPPQGLCLLRVGYPIAVFPEAAWYDCQPRFQLGFSDPPEPSRAPSWDHQETPAAGPSDDPQALNRPSGRVD